MNEYLESLVLKGEEPVEKPAEKVAAESVEEVVEEVAQPEEEADPVEEAPTEEPKEEAPAVVEEAKEEKKAEVKISANKEVAKHDDVPATADDPVAVVDIRIFNTPDPKGYFKIFSGNVIVKGEVDTMKSIEYMKPGFGLVKGFTPDLK